MMSAALIYNDDAGAFDLSGRAGIGNDIATSVIISLFSDGRATADDRLPDDTGDRRGWWADSYTSAGAIGSRLWLISREKLTDAVVQSAADYARAALRWLTDDGVADAVEVRAERDDRSGLRLRIEITAPDASLADEPDDDIEIDGIRVALTIRAARQLNAGINAFHRGT